MRVWLTWNVRRYGAETRVNFIVVQRARYQPGCVPTTAASK